MIKNDLINRVCERTGLPRPKAVEAVEAVIGLMRSTLVNGDRIELRGLGVFVVKKRKRGIGRNPRRPEEEVEIPPGLTIRFKPGKELRDLVPSGPAGEGNPGPA